jgi:hypothetical protein
MSDADILRALLPPPDSPAPRAVADVAYNRLTGRPVGVLRHRRRYKALAWFDGRYRYVGTFTTEREAILARRNFLAVRIRPGRGRRPQ